MTDRQEALVALYSCDVISRLPALDTVRVMFASCAPLYRQYLYAYPDLHSSFFNLSTYAHLCYLELNIARCYYQYSPQQLRLFVANHFKANFEDHPFYRLARQFLAANCIEMGNLYSFALSCLLYQLEYQLEYADFFIDNQSVADAKQMQSTGSSYAEIQALQANINLQRQLKMTETELQACVDAKNDLEKQILALQRYNEQDKREAHRSALQALESENEILRNRVYELYKQNYRSHADVESSHLYVDFEGYSASVQPLAYRNLITESRRMADELRESETERRRLYAQIYSMQEEHNACIALQQQKYSLEAELGRVVQFSKQHISRLCNRAAQAKEAAASWYMQAYKSSEASTAVYQKVQEMACELQAARYELYQHNVAEQYLQKRLRLSQKRNQMAERFLDQLFNQLKGGYSYNKRPEESTIQADKEAQSVVKQIRYVEYNTDTRTICSGCTGGAISTGGSRSSADSIRKTLLDVLDYPYIKIYLAQALRKGSLGIRRRTSSQRGSGSVGGGTPRVLDLATDMYCLNSSSDETDFYVQGQLIRSIASLSE